jgi:hypothetical protein
VSFSAKVFDRPFLLGVKLATLVVKLRLHFQFILPSLLIVADGFAKAKHKVRK